MKLIIDSQQIDLMILATKFQKLLTIKGVEVEVLFLRRKTDYDDCYILDYPEETKHAIELLTPTKKKETTFSRERVASMKPLKFNEFEKLNTNSSFEKYISNFYKKEEEYYLNTHNICSITRNEYEKEYNSSDFIGKLCAQLYFDYEQEQTNLFQNLHKDLISLNKLLEETLRISISHVFPPETDFIASVEASWEPPLGYD